jgi:L-ascorbate 6-phosphate lactonase
MGEGEHYEMRLGKPRSLSNLRSEWFDWFLAEVSRCEPKGNSVVLWALGGAGFILKTRTATVYVDPYVGGSVEAGGLMLYRMIPIPFDASSVREIDGTVITHEHIDHLNEDFVLPVSGNTKCKFVGPSSVAELLNSWGIPRGRIVSLDKSEETRIKDVRVVAFPANDPSSRSANTYLFDTGKVKLFHSGDSFHFHGFAEIGKQFDIDVAMVTFAKNPPGKKWYNDSTEFIKIARDTRPRVVIPMHWDLWSVLLENPHLVEKELAMKEPNITVEVLRVGQRFDCA